MSTELPSSTRPAPRRVRILPFWLISVTVLLAVPLGLCGLFLRGCANEHYRPPGQVDITFDISDSGETIVFNAVGTGGRDLYLLRLSDSSVTCVASTPEYEVTPSFSPDGKSLVYAAGVPGDRADHIFVRPLDGTGARQVTQADANDSSPRVSPDGAWSYLIGTKPTIGAAWRQIGAVAALFVSSAWMGETNARSLQMILSRTGRGSCLMANRWPIGRFPDCFPFPSIDRRLPPDSSDWPARMGAFRPATEGSLSLRVDNSKEIRNSGSPI